MSALPISDIADITPGPPDPNPAFPLHVLPNPFRDYIATTAASIGVPPELVAAPLLAFSGATIGRRIQIKIAENWFERPALWIALVAPSGAGKSPAIGAARTPLDLLQSHFIREYRIESPNYHTKPTARTSIDRIYLTESKFESIINALFGNVGLTIIQDELNGFFRRITRSGERQRYLSLWSSEPILTVRQSNPTFWLQHPVVSIVGGIQPSLITDLWSHNRDGLIERFLLVHSAADQPIPPDSTAKPMSPKTLGEVTLVLLKLRGLGGRFTRSNGIIASPSPDAAKHWQSWLDQNTDQQRNAPESLKGFYRKLPAHVARLALILHAIHNPDKPGDPIELETMTNAIELGEFFRHHLLRTVELIGNRTGSAATRIPLPDRILHLLAQTDAPEGWLGRTTILVTLGRPDTSAFNAAAE